MSSINVYVGFDQRESVAFHVFCHSVLARTKAQVAFIPVSGVRGDSSNSFGKARFLVPHMQGFRGRCIWADGDMLCRVDIESLVDELETGMDVALVKHDYSTKFPTKYLGAPNEDYPRKNWSSLMVLECGNYPWKKLTPGYVSNAKSSHLHRFEFLKDERIGDLSKEWNWLVSEYPYNPGAKLAHFSIGLPVWAPYRNCDYSDEWREELRQMNYFEAWEPDSFDDTVKVSER